MKPNVAEKTQLKKSRLCGFTHRVITSSVGKEDKEKFAMRQIPDCLQRRYKAMDELITDLGSAITIEPRIEHGYPTNEDRGIKLMCKFWNILKEDPDCDLEQAVQERMALNTRGSGMFGPHNITCYQCGKDELPKTSVKCGKDTCAKSLDPNSTASGTSCCNRTPAVSPKPSLSPNCSTHSTHLCAKHAAAALKATPIQQALGNMKQAASTEKKCYQKAADLMKVQEQLKVQISMLEQREQDEVALLKEADAMWAAMEDEYKQKLQTSKCRQENLLRQQREVETSASKWRKNKKNLEEQMTNVDKCVQELREKYKKKTNDLKTIEVEIIDMAKRIEGNTKELDNASNALEAKKQGFEKRMEKLSEESEQLQITKSKEEALKEEKILKGNECVKEAREELAKICRVLLKKKLENEDLRAEAKALIEEIDLLKTTCDICGEKCKNKQHNLESEITKCNAEIEKFQLRCTKCHVSCDTRNLRKYCTDCPRCREEMDPCVYTAGDKCTELAMNECVCMDIKNKFMNNVFENMYTVLERQINTSSGKAVSEQVLKCLRSSTNGKLDPETRKKLQNFILASVKTNLNLTIIGGAVKTRCEMDPETYKEMLLCLTKVKAEKPQKVDKGTDSRKEPCARWGGTNECNCPKGPKNCVCKKKAPPPSSDPTPCGQLDEDKKDIGELSMCPHKEKTPCGPLCGNVQKPDIATKLSKSWKPAPCAEKSCTFSSNMKTARCALRNSFNSRACGTRGHKTNVPIVMSPTDFESFTELPCDCGGGYSNCVCYGSSKSCILDEVVVPSEAELKKMFNQKHTTLPVTVVGQNGTQADLNAELMKTNSGHMALNVRRISHVGDIASNMEEYPVSLFKTSSMYKLIVCENNAKPNAILKRGSPGEINVVLKNVSNSTENKTVNITPQEKLFRVRVKNMEADPDCTIIKRTCSGNFEFVFEKEFEKCYKEVINDSLYDNCECSVNLSKTVSGTRIIDFEQGCDCWQNYHNALLTKSSSGNVKLIVQDLDFMALKKEKYLFNKYRIGFENLYKQLSTCSAVIRKKPHPKQNSLDRKLENGLLLGENIRMKVQDEDHLVADLLIILNKISPGQYSVTFNNRAAEPFIGNLLTSWLGLLPVKKISECNLIVNLNWGTELKHRFGWLIMSSNGKIVMVVDGKVTKGVQLDANSVSCVLCKERAITTTCNQKTDCCDCDPSKCICDKFSQEWNDWNLM